MPWVLNFECVPYQIEDALPFLVIVLLLHSSIASLLLLGKKFRIYLSRILNVSILIAFSEIVKILWRCHHQGLWRRERKFSGLQTYATVLSKKCWGNFIVFLLLATVSIYLLNVCCIAFVGIIPFYFRMACPVIITDEGHSESAWWIFQVCSIISIRLFDLVSVHSFPFLLIIVVTPDANCLLCSGAQLYLVSSDVMCGIYF
jgi:hypothetical protein